MVLYIHMHLVVQVEGIAHTDTWYRYMHAHDTVIPMILGITGTWYRRYDMYAWLQ